MNKNEWAKLLAQEGVRLILFAVAAFVLWHVFRKKGNNAKAAVATAASLAGGVPTL